MIVQMCPFLIWFFWQTKLKLYEVRQAQWLTYELSYPLRMAGCQMLVQYDVERAFVGFTVLCLTTPVGEISERKSRKARRIGYNPPPIPVPRVRAYCPI